MNKGSKQHSKDNSTTKYNPSNITSKSRQTIQSINLKLLKRSKKKLVSKYSVNQTFYPRKKINELIYNEDSLYACAFKEFLIYEDENEFLKKYYYSQAGKSKLRNITIFYDKYSKMFPNYIILPESNILYKNIQKKQKMIDKLQEMKKEEEKEKNKRNQRSSCDIFDTTAKNSILNESNSFMFNYQNIYNYNDEDNDNKSIEQIEKIHNIIDKADKLLESLSSRRGEENIINQKSKKFNIELIKLHNSPSPMQKSNAFLNNNQALSNASLSNNINSTSSMLITKNNHNNSLDKAKAFEKKLNQNLSAIANINCLNIAHLKKNNIIPVIISSPRDDNSTVKSPRNSVLNKRILVHSQSHNGNFSQLNQKFTKKELIGSNNHNNSSSNNSLLNNNTNNGSKIMGGNTYRKLQKNMLDIESLTQKSNKRRIDILKIDGMNGIDLFQFPSNILSKTQHHFKNVKKNAMRSANISPIFRSNKNSPLPSYNRHNSLIESEKRQEREILMTKRAKNNTLKMALKRKYGIHFVLSKQNTDRNNRKGSQMLNELQ